MTDGFIKLLRNAKSQEHFINHIPILITRFRSNVNKYRRFMVSASALTLFIRLYLLLKFTVSKYCNYL